MANLDPLIVALVQPRAASLVQLQLLLATAKQLEGMCRARLATALLLASPVAMLP
jgi:hypothetical protein